MVESVIKCYALYLFLPCATRPNGSGHPGRCGNAACKGQNFHAELCPLSISPEIVGSRLNNGAASVFLGALGERHGGLQHALHCFWRKAPRFVIARRPEADVAISCRQLRFRRQLSHNPARYCEIATGAKRPRNDNSGGVTPQNPCATCCWPAWRSGSAATDAIGAHRFNSSLYRLQVPSRDCHGRKAPSQ